MAAQVLCKWSFFYFILLTLEQIFGGISKSLAVAPIAFIKCNSFCLSSITMLNPYSSTGEVCVFNITRWW